MFKMDSCLRRNDNAAINRNIAKSGDKSFDLAPFDPFGYAQGRQGSGQA